MHWVRDAFRYDFERALELAEDSPVRPDTKIYTPRETFDAQAGTCVDLCRFAVETLRVIDPATLTHYLMIEFEPIRVAGRTLRRHWLGVYERPPGLVGFADTKYPGEISDPYSSLAELMEDYEARRGRRVITYQLRGTFLKELKRRRQTKAQMTPAPRGGTTNGR